MTPDHDHDAAEGSLTPARRNDGGQVLDVEVLGQGDKAGAGAGGNQDSRQVGGNGWSEQASSGPRVYRVSASYSNGRGFGRVWTSGGVNGNGCLAPCITFAIFLVCLSQFGLLAGIGFAVFHAIGGIAGSIRSMRLLVEGQETNPWHWRLGNWFISFMLTMWLAGGFNG